MRVFNPDIPPDVACSLSKTRAASRSVRGLPPTCIATAEAICGSFSTQSLQKLFTGLSIQRGQDELSSGFSIDNDTRDAPSRNDHAKLWVALLHGT